MTAQIARDSLISPEEYLEGELVSPIKHEYLGGVVYAMAGARNVHNDIAGNAFDSLHARLRGKPCRPYNSDTKVRLRLPAGLRFYYPDLQVTCHPNPPNDSFQDQPIVVLEVISESTRRADEAEKRDGYLALPSLDVYLLVESERALVIGYRRGPAGFTREVFSGFGAVISLAGIGTDLPLAEVYDRVVFSTSEAGES
jgi:Uma2 family endonuclease